MEGSAKKKTDDRKGWIQGRLEKRRNREQGGEEAGQELVMRMRVSVRSWGQIRDKEGSRGWYVLTGQVNGRG